MIPTQPPGLSSRKKWIFRVLALAFPLILLVAAEFGLRSFGMVPLPPPIVPSTPKDGHRTIGSSGINRYLVEGEDGLIHTHSEAVSQRFLHDLTFTKSPKAGVLRIICFGGSATMGVPYEDTPELAFPHQLQLLLEEGGIPAEVINLGGASFGSRQVLELAREVVDYKPDALIVYSGNNEFFQYNLELHQANQAHLVLAQGLEKLHLVRGARQLYAQLKGEDPQGLNALTPLDPQVLRSRQDAVTASLMSRSWQAADDALPQLADSGLYQRQDIHAKTIVSTYKNNLEAVAALTTQGLPQVFVIAMPANLRNAPMLSLHAPRLGAFAQSRFGSAMAAGQVAAKAKDWAEAIQYFEAATEEDPLYAMAWYRLGMSHLYLDHQKEAKMALNNALELDMNPGRPPASLRAVAWDLEKNTKISTLDGTPPFLSWGKSPLGNGLFADSCHLTPKGNQRLALEIASGLLAKWSISPPIRP